jgi:DNA polymerase-1
MQLLIDADMLLYKFGFRNQEIVEWSNGAVTEKVDFFGAVDEIKKFTSELLTKTGCTQPIYCLSSKSNFRHKILDTYKHNRDHSKRPILFGELKKYMRDNFRVKSFFGLEADDVMGILSTRNPGKYCIATLDKDLRQIPGWHFNWKKEEEPVKVTHFEGECLFYRQVLMGDSVDGYGGCPRIGKVKSARIIDSCIHLSEEYPNGYIDPLEVWEVIKETYAKAGLDEEYILQQARMARILQSCDFEWSTKKPILWTPKTFSSILPNA